MTRALHPLLLIFLLLPMLVHAKLQPLDSIVAVVNDNVILKSELDKAVADAVDNLNARKVSIPPLSVLQRQVLQSLVVRHLQLAMAKRMNISVDNQRLNQALQNYASRQGLNSLDALRKALKRQGKDYNQFREDFREEMTISQLQQRSVGPLVNVSDQEVDNYLASLQAQGQLDVEYHLAHILIATPQAASSDKIASIRKQAEQVLQSLKQGADFAKTAVEKSTGSNALNGGDLGWLKTDQLPTLFTDVAPKLKPGQISGLLRNSSGFHIIKLLAVRSQSGNNRSTDIDQLKAQARQAIFQRKFREQLEQWLHQLREEAYVEIRL